MDLAVELKKLQGKRLLTLYQKKPFEITQVSNNQVVLKTSKESRHIIPLEEVANAWKLLQKQKELTMSNVRDLGDSEINPTYVVAMLANLQGVKYSLSPIVLRLQ
jgi:hypothetical protein